MEALLGAIPMAASVFLLGGFGLLMFRKPIARKIESSRSGKFGSVEWDDVNSAQKAEPASSGLPRLPKIEYVPDEFDTAISPPPTPQIVLGEAGEEIAATIRADLERMGEPLSDQVERVVRALALSRLMGHHQHNYRVIYGTQIALLEAVNELRVTTVGEAAVLFETTYADPTAANFALWLQFLADAQYLLWDRDQGPTASLEITKFGRDFLSYLVGARLPRAKPN